MNYVSDCEMSCCTTNTTVQDTTCPNLFAETLDHSDRILALKKQEDTTYRYQLYVDRDNGRRAYCTEGENAANAASMVPSAAGTSELRGRICTWMFWVVDNCNFPRGLAEISLSLFDRCVASCGGIRNRGDKVVW